jgi:ribosomal biogenesis protein LAS1
VVISQDHAAQAQGNQLALRQSYASAIIRLVNGLVDPLQFGAYARSISSIANQLGLPSWLVELRHAATHEDLPSLELLREAAREVSPLILEHRLLPLISSPQSMRWLLHNYLLPTINPSSAPESQTASLRPLMPILKQYKSLLKITTRDVSLRSQHDLAISSVMKDIEKWVAEGQVAANINAGEVGWEQSANAIVLDSGELDAKDRWTLEKLCDVLLEKGALVPLSKK